MSVPEGAVSTSVVEGASVVEVAVGVGRTSY